MGISQSEPLSPQQKVQNKIYNHAKHENRKNWLGGWLGSISSDIKVDKDIEWASGILSDAGKFKQKYYEGYFNPNMNEATVVMKERDWKVKVVLTSIHANPLLLMFGTKIKKFDFGPVHAAVICGPYVYGWDQKEYIYPTKVSEFKDEYTVASIDIGEIKDTHKEWAIEQICEEVVRWNCDKSYHVMSSNCQNFVNELLKKLGYEDPLFRQTQEFLERIQSNPLGFKYTFEWKGEMIEFISHQQLDQFYNKNQIGMEQGDHQLLKAYDRMFWFKYLALESKNAKQSLSIDKSEISKYEGLMYCPFKDPRNPENGTLFS